MTFTGLKLKWAKRLLKAKYFVVLTDKESAIAIDGADPSSFTDMLALTAQAAEIDEFYSKLGELVKQHRDAVTKLTGGASVTLERTPAKARKAKAKS